MSRSQLGTQLRYTGFEAGSLQGEVNAGRLPSWQLPNGSNTGPGFIAQEVQTQFKSSGNNAMRIRITTANGDTGCRIYHNTITMNNLPNREMIMVADAMIPVYIQSNRFYNIFQIKQRFATGGSELLFGVNVRIRGGNNTGGPMQPVFNFGQWHWNNQWNMNLPATFPISAGLIITPGQWFRMKIRLKHNTFNGTTPNNDGRCEYWLNFNHAGGFPLASDVLVNDYDNIYTNFYFNGRAQRQMAFNPTTFDVSVNNYAGSSNPSITDVYLDNFGIYLPASDTPAPPPDPEPEPEPNPPTGEITDGIVASYRFEQNSILDDDTSFNNGTNINTSIGAGRNGNALVYNGTDAYSSTPNSTTLTLTTAISISMDVYPTAVGQSNFSRLIVKYTGDGTTNDVWSIAYNPSGQIRFRIYINSTLYDFTTTGTLNLNQWNRIVVRWLSTEAVRISINGSEEVAGTARTGTFTNNTNPVTIGGLPDIAGRTNRMFTGRIDNVIIWNRKISDTQRDTMFDNFPTYLNLIGSTDPSLPPINPQLPLELSRIKKKIGVKRP